MKKEFTLIELLIVVAIIGVLASLLMPVLGKARATSRASVCVNQLKQVMFATVMSLDDQDGKFHSPTGTTTGSYYNPLWSRNLYDKKYILDSSVFVCPSSGRKNYSGGWGAYGARFTGGSAKFAGSKGGDIDTKTFNSNTWMMGDSYSFGGRWFRMYRNLNNGYASPWVLHVGKGNMAFFDGHISSLSPAQYSPMSFNAVISEGKNVIAL